MTITTEKPVVPIQTARFGEIRVEEELVITLPNGLIGFAQCERFVVLDPGGAGPLKWFQSLDDGAVAFPIIDPWCFQPDYAPTLSDADAGFLGLDPSVAKLVFVIV